MFEGKKKRKSIVDALTYAYIRKVKKWMFCPACQQGKMIINKKSTHWLCEDCGYKLSADEFEDNYVFWFCDECDTYLNNQEGFDRNAIRHICKKCGYENDTTFDNVKGICSDCGKIIPDPDGRLCIECKQARQAKAKAWLKTAGKVVGTAAAVVGAVYVGSQLARENGYQSPSLSYNGDDGCTKKCAHCGNVDEVTLWDEGETIFCSRCHHRTSKVTGEDDVVECPYCHRMRDRKALYCRWCNDSTWKVSSKEEFNEIDKALRDLGY